MRKSVTGPPSATNRMNSSLNQTLNKSVTQGINQTPRRTPNAPLTSGKKDPMNSSINSGQGNVGKSLASLSKSKVDPMNVSNNSQNRGSFANKV